MLTANVRVLRQPCPYDHPPLDPGGCLYCAYADQLRLAFDSRIEAELELFWFNDSNFGILKAVERVPRTLQGVEKRRLAALELAGVIPEGGQPHD